VPVLSDEYWLLDGGADKLYLPFFESYVAQGANGVDVGTGFTLTDDRAYSLGINAFVGMPISSSAMTMSSGLAFSASLTPSSATSFSFNAVFRFPSMLESATISASQNIYFPVDNGTTAVLLSPVITFSGSVGLVDTDLAASGSGAFQAGATATMNTVERTGTLVSLTDAARMPVASLAIEDRLSLDVMQAIPFLPMTLLGVEARASAGFGSLATLKGSNAALGIDSTGSNVYAYDGSILVFLGVPLINHLEEQLFNAIVLQSLNIALVYQAATAFDTPADIPLRFQHAVGAEFLPFLRTFGDAGIGLGIGMGFDLNAIAAAPQSASSWVPSVFVDVSALPSLFSAVTPY
jgi:hypothetical protein